MFQILEKWYSTTTITERSSFLEGVEGRAEVAGGGETPADEGLPVVGETPATLKSSASSATSPKTPSLIAPRDLSLVVRLGLLRFFSRTAVAGSSPE